MVGKVTGNNNSVNNTIKESSTAVVKQKIADQMVASAQTDAKKSLVGNRAGVRIDAMKESGNVTSASFNMADNVKKGTDVVPGQEVAGKE